MARIKETFNSRAWFMIECTTCTNIMIDPIGWKDGQCPECIKEEIPNERS